MTHVATVREQVGKIVAIVRVLGGSKLPPQLWLNKGLGAQADVSASRRFPDCATHHSHRTENTIHTIYILGRMGKMKICDKW